MMNERINKPRVFLSHSKADIDFIGTVCDDLRKCQIEPWRDSEEIRHGKPWLDAIFEDGIPTCDSVLVYFTENSLKSKMVKKEIDAGILQQLNEGGVSFLPYVSEADIRQYLRSDIRSLQVPVWNIDNYSSLLPCVVAEIWRSFLERTISNAIKTERIRRLEAEIELEKLRKQSSEKSVFTDSEERDYQYIQREFDRFEPVTFEKTEKSNESGSQPRVIARDKFEVNIGTLLPFIADSKHSEYRRTSVVDLLRNTLEPGLPVNDSEQKDWHLSAGNYLDLADELLMYGFVERVSRESSPNEGRIAFLRIGPSYHFVYTSRVERYKYWLAYKGLFPDTIVWRRKD